MKNNILITGGTGGIGPHLVSRLALDEEVSRVYVLARGKSCQPNGQCRRRKYIDQFRKAIPANENADLSSKKIVLMEGDVTKTRLGISRELERSRINVLIHAAADTGFAKDKKQLHEVNVRGTRNAIHLAQQLSQVEKFIYLSTACVSGIRTGSIEEAFDPRPAPFVNAYEETKWLAEQHVTASHLPWSILRLGTAIGDSETGWVNRPGAFHHLLRWMQRGLIPLIASHSESRVDLIPSDFVADWISDAVRQPYLAGVYQLTPGRQALKTDRLVELVADEFRAFDPAWHNGQVLPPQLVSAEMFEQFREFVADSKDALFTTILESTDSFLPSLLYPRVYRNQRAMSVSRSLERLDRTLLEQTVRRVLQRCIANKSVANPLGAEK